MDESDEALSIDSTEGESVYDSYEENSGGSSENETERPGNEQGREDLISALPDSIIQHIISFLPSTKRAIQTGILSKRWYNQWSRVPILIFYSNGMNDRNFSQFIDRTLVMHDCSKLKKFQVEYYHDYGCDPQLTSKIMFATRKQVEELILNLYPGNHDRLYLYNLPEFLSINDALVKLELFKCHFHHQWRPCWPSLKELKLECSSLHPKAIENAVSGSPLLELLELTDVCFKNNVIASESLKRLVIIDGDHVPKSGPVAISCPNLEELSIRISESSENGYSLLPDETIENVLSSCHLLHTLELLDVSYSVRFVIASKSLKKLVLRKFYFTTDIEILCPGLEESNLFGFEPDCNSRSLAMKMLRQLQHVNLLEIGNWFIKILSVLEMEGQSSPVLNCKCLTLDGTNFDNSLPGIIHAIRSSPMLEKLIIKFPLYKHHSTAYPPGLNDCRKPNCWNSNGTVINCLVSNLKTVKIVGICEKDDKHKLLFSFVEFLLMNSQVLEKIIIVLAIARCGAGFAVEVSRKLLGFQRCYPHISVVLCYS